MLIYALELLWVALCKPFSNYTIKIGRKAFIGKKVYLILTFGMLAFVMVLRGPNIGSDTYTYYKMFLHIGNSSTLSEAFTNSTITAPIYVIYARILYTICQNPQILTAMNSIVICLGFAIFIYKTSSNVMGSVFLLIGLTMHYESMNGARQFMAIVFALNAILYLYKNLKSKFGWFLYILSIGIHNTSIIVLVIIGSIFLAKKVRLYKNLNKASVIISIICILALQGLTAIFLILFPYYGMYLNGKNPASILENTGGGRIILLYIALLCVILLQYHAMCLGRIKYGSFEYLLYPSAVFCILIGIAFCKNNLINRLLWYYVCLFITLIPNIYSKYNNKMKIALYIITIIGLLGYCFIQLYENKSGIVPYRFYW